jgi:PAS domain S-box-containing protein
MAMDINGLAPTGDATRRLSEVVRRLRQPAPGEAPAAAEELTAIVAELERGEETLRLREQELEAAILEAQAQRVRYQELFEFAPEAYLVTDGRGVIQEANHAAARLLQSRKTFLAGKPLPFYVAGGWRADFYARLSRLKSRDVFGQWETCLQQADGPPRHVALTVTAIPRAESRLDGYRWLLQDITPRKQAEVAFRAEKQFADSLVDAVEAIVLVIDAAGPILRSNPYLHRASGYGADELRGLDWCELLPESDRTQARDMVFQALVSGASGGGVFALLTRSGRRRVIAWSARVLKPEGGRADVVLLGQDVTDLQEAQDKALRTERLAAIGQMVAGLAHESRNALQRIQAGLERLSFRLAGQPDALDLLARMQQAQDDLLRLFNDVRDYAGPIHLERRVCNLAEVWREAWANLVFPPNSRAARLREEIADLDLWCVASPFHLRQVFRNVLDNAVSAGGTDSPIVLRSVSAEIDGRPAIQVSVCDRGPGFTPEQRQKAFEPFFTTKVRGTGLGLAICKRIVEAHGGRIELGRNGPGAEVVMTLPRGMS